MAGEVRAPDRVLVVEANGAERDGHLQRPPVRIEVRLGKPVRVPVPVEDGAFTGRLNIQLSADWIDDEEVAVPATVEGIQPDLDAVVLPDRHVTLGQGGPDPVHPGIPAGDAEVEVPAVVHDPHLRLLRCGNPFLKFALPEIVNELGFPPAGFVEKAVHHNRFFGPIGVNALVLLFGNCNRPSCGGQE